MSDWQYKDFGIGKDTWKYPKCGTIKNGDLKQWSGIDNFHKAQQSEIQSLQEQRDIAVEALKGVYENDSACTSVAIELADEALKKIEEINADS